MKRILPLLSALFLPIVAHGALIHFTEDWSGYTLGNTATQIVAGGAWKRLGYSNSTLDSSMEIVDASGRSLRMINNGASFMGLVSSQAFSLGNGLVYDANFRVERDAGSSFNYVRMIVRSDGSNANQYVLDVRDTQIILRKFVNSTDTNLHFYDFKTGEFNFSTDYQFSLKLESEGEGMRISVYQGGEFRFDFVDSAPPLLGAEINVAFQVRSATPSSAPVIFGDLSVTAIPEPPPVAMIGIAGLLLTGRYWGKVRHFIS